MGIYIYHLTTQKRRLKVNGQREDFYLSKFAGKETYREDRWTKLRDARAIRLENAWAGRPHPKFVVTGFEPGYAVYTNWRKIGGGPVVQYVEEAPGDFAGFLRDDGKGGVVFEPWEMLEKNCSSLSELHEVRSSLTNFMSGRSIQVSTHPSFPRDNEPCTLRVHYRDKADGALIKVAIG